MLTVAFSSCVDARNRRNRTCHPGRDGENRTARYVHARHVSHIWLAQLVFLSFVLCHLNTPLSDVMILTLREKRQARKETSTSLCGRWQPLRHSSQRKRIRRCVFSHRTIFLSLLTCPNGTQRELQQLTDTSGASGHQKLRVCEVCGAYLSVLDSDRRLADHFGGKVRAISCHLRSTHVSCFITRAKPCFFSPFHLACLAPKLSFFFLPTYPFGSFASALPLPSMPASLRPSDETDAPLWSYDDSVLEWALMWEPATRMPSVA